MRKLDDQKVKICTVTESIVCENSLEDDPTKHLYGQSGAGIIRDWGGEFEGFY